MEFYELYNQIPTSPPGMASDLLDLPSLPFTPLETNYLDVDFTLSPCTESGCATSTNLLEVLRTTQGKPMILHQDNLFQQRSELKESLSYRRNLYHTRNGSCPAVLITTDKDRSLLLSFNGPHNHPDRNPNTLDKHGPHNLPDRSPNTLDKHGPHNLTDRSPNTLDKHGPHNHPVRSPNTLDKHGPHNHPDRSPNTLDNHRKRHRLTYIL